jgi:hypothetical protein
MRISPLCTLLSSNILGVPFDHGEQIELCRSSKRAVVPLLYEHQQRRFRLLQHCLWVDSRFWLVLSIFELQSLRRRVRQVCVFRGPS